MTGHPPCINGNGGIVSKELGTMRINASEFHKANNWPRKRARGLMIAKTAKVKGVSHFSRRFKWKEN